MALTFHGRLPGVLCNTALSASQGPSVRLNVAAFVGFAERGPLNQPIAVEDISQYHAVFGGDLLLARHQKSSQPVYAHLPTTVQAFFNNGGRHCYVVRVAGDDARPNRFRLPGLLAWNQETLKTVIAPAASVGSWSNTLRLGTQLGSTPLASTKATIGNDGITLEVIVPFRSTIRSGDILHLQFDTPDKHVIFCSVDTVTPTAHPTSTLQEFPVTVQSKTGTYLTFTRSISSISNLPSIQKVEVLHQQWSTTSASGAITSKLINTQTKQLLFALSQTMLTQASQPEQSANVLQQAPHIEGGYYVQIELPDAITITLGDVLIINDTLRFPVTAVENRGEDVGHTSVGSNMQKKLRVTSNSPYWQLPVYAVEYLTENGWQTSKLPIYHLIAPLDFHQPYTLHLSAEAQVHVGDVLRVTYQSQDSQSVSHENKLLFPLSDVDLAYTQDDSSSSGTPILQAISRGALWETQHPMTTPNAAITQIDVLSFDLFIQEGHDAAEVWQSLRFGPGTNYWIDRCVPPLLPAMAQSENVSQRVPGLDTSRSARLGIPYITDNSVPLYFPLGMDELSNQAAWAAPLPETQESSASTMLSKDGLTHFTPIKLFLDPRLADVSTRDLLTVANQLLYLNSGVPVQPLQKLHSLLAIDEIGLIALPDLVHRAWNAPEAGTQLSSISSIDQPRSQAGNSFQPLCLLLNSTYDESLPVNLLRSGNDVLEPLQQLNALPILQTVEQYEQQHPSDGQQTLSEEQLTVQHALVNFCAARADVLAVLSLPQHFTRREVLAWQRAFVTGQAGGATSPVLSYAAVYHPWVQAREELTPQLAPLRANPPDGTICGMIAARELLRGPWIAPANLPLLGVVGLTPTLTTADWSDLFNAQINLLRHQPGQFAVLSAHTLSTDNLLLQVSVRRLLIYLRKLALQRGAQYVFETHNERFRQRVQASFEQTLTSLMAQGALNAFEVVTGSEVNTANDLDNGRFLIALKIAPTQPIEFITIVLLRAGENLLQTLER